MPDGPAECDSKVLEDGMPCGRTSDTPLSVFLSATLILFSYVFRPLSQLSLPACLPPHPHPLLPKAALAWALLKANVQRC